MGCWVPFGGFNFMFYWGLYYKILDTSMNLTQDEINKIVLFFVDYYGYQEIHTYRNEQATISQKVRYYTKLHPFKQDETGVLKELDPHFKEMLSVQLSFQVFAFEILAEWARDTDKELRPFLNISETKIKRGHLYYFKELIVLKRRNGFKHKQVKEIMDISVAKAHEFYNFLKKYKRET